MKKVKMNSAAARTIVQKYLDALAAEELKREKTAAVKKTKDALKRKAVVKSGKAAPKAKNVLFKIGWTNMK